MNDVSRLEKLKQFEQANPIDSFVLYAIALEYFSQNNIENAEKYFKKTLETDEYYLAAYYHLAKLFSQKKEEKNATELLKKGMQKAKEKNDRHTFAEMQNAFANIELGLGFDGDE